MTSLEEGRGSQYDHADIASAPLSRKLDAYSLRLLIESTALNEYVFHPAVFRDTAHKSRTLLSNKVRANWRTTLDKEIMPAPDDFTSMNRLYQGSAVLNEFELVYGSWEKPGKPNSGDFVRVWQQGGILFGVIGDGSSMMLTADEVHPAVREASTVHTAAGDTFLPDHLWTSLVYRNFFDGNQLQIAPDMYERISPYGFMEDERIYPAEAVVDAWLTSGQDSDVLTDIFERCQQNLYISYAGLFGDVFMSEPANVRSLPSGIMNVFALYPDGTFDYAYTGDIDTCEVDSYGDAVVVSTETVTAHDAASRWIGRDDREFVASVAASRVPDVGNVTGLVHVPVRRGTLKLVKNGGVVLRTDGERLNWIDSTFRIDRNVPLTAWPRRRADVAGSLLFRNPEIFQLDLIREQRKWRRYAADPYNRNKPVSRIKWRADDASYVRIRMK